MVDSDENNEVYDSHLDLALLRYSDVPVSLGFRLKTLNFSINFISLLPIA